MDINNPGDSTAQDELYAVDDDAWRALLVSKPWSRNPHHFKQYDADATPSPKVPPIGVILTSLRAFVRRTGLKYPH